MDHSPSREANKFLISQEFSRSSWNPKIHYRVITVRHLSLPEPDGSSPRSFILFL